MSTEIATQQPKTKSVLWDMASRFNMEPKNFEATLKATVMPANISNEQFAAFLLVAKEYNLNPLTKEIYAFATKSGRIQPIVGIDGWVRIINEHPKFDGMTFEDNFKGNELLSIKCSIYRKDRDKPTIVTEYLSECRGTSEPWQRWPVRMLRHKALIQCARYAFGFSGIIDPDEAERIKDVTPQDNKPLKEAFEASIVVDNSQPPQNKMDEILSQPTPKAPKAPKVEVVKGDEVIEDANTPMQRRADEIIMNIHNATSKKEIGDIMKENSNHIEAMDEELYILISMTEKEKIKTF